MKNNRKQLLFIFIFAVLMMIPVMKNVYYGGHDTGFHVANIDALTDEISLKNLNLFPSAVVPKVANNFGYGTRIFYPPVPHMTAAYVNLAIRPFGLDTLEAMRITQFLVFFLSGITFYYLGLKVFKNKTIALIGSFFYMTMPYHLSEVFIRDAFSEMFIPIAIPMIVFGLLELVEGNKRKFYWLFTAGYVLSIFSHMAMSIYLTIMLLITFFIIYRKQIFKRDRLLALCISGAMILLITAPFTVQMAEHKLFGTYAVFVPHYMTGSGGLQFSTLKLTQYIDFFKPIGWGNIRFTLMLFQYILIICAFIFHKKLTFFKENEQNKKMAKFFIVFTLLALYMTSELCLWYFTPTLLDTLQFPWRLAIYFAFGGSFLACFWFTTMTKKPYFNKMMIGFAALTLIGSYLYTAAPSSNKVSLEKLNYNDGMGWQQEYIPINTNSYRDYFYNRDQLIHITNGKADVRILENPVPDMDFTVANIEGEITIELPRLYYLGYRLTKDGKTIPINENEKGFIGAKITEAGNYQLRYPNTTLQHIACGVSVLTIVSGCTVAFLTRKKKGKKHEKN